MGDASYGKLTTLEVEAWIRKRIAEFVNVEIDVISRDASFESFGVDSAKAISLMTDFEESLELPDELALELLFEAETIAQAAENIFEALREMAKSDPQFTELQ